MRYPNNSFATEPANNFNITINSSLSRSRSGIASRRSPSNNFLSRTATLNNAQLTGSRSQLLRLSVLSELSRGRSQEFVFTEPGVTNGSLCVHSAHVYNGGGLHSPPNRAGTPNQSSDEEEATVYLRTDPESTLSMKLELSNHPGDANGTIYGTYLTTTGL